MRLYKKLIAVFMVSLFVLPVNAVTVQAFGCRINIDGYCDDWSGKPCSWEYPNDNDCPKGQNHHDIKSRHQMSINCDGEYVYLHIELCTKEKSGLNGENYQFWCDNEKTVFEISYAGGDKINKRENQMESGIYSLEVRHQHGPLNNTVVTGAVATYTIKEHHENNELEMKIPLSAMAEQNYDITPDNVRLIEFFCPYLMFRRIACSGASTAPYIGITLSAAFIGGAFYLNKRKLRSKKA